ncbi:uncharacterized protein LOC108042554 [Drosophila rhopaloa]|uniref:Uncharacterized protein LOC108042554 n=1 Tax=Drosophila rhopaloa TaxID=1041015 RepID=A0A6P4EMW2_DRORH|nr:uncharacterized protein LOC108042554 [Drosophila rhopaloa]
MGNLKKLIGLPLEIHDLIYQSLDNLEDKLRLARVDKVLASAFKHHCRIEFENLHVDEVPVRLWPTLFPLCGPMVLHIYTHKNEDISPLFNLIERYCTNLESISFCLSSRNRRVVKNFMRNMSNLKEINVYVKNASPKLLRFLKDLPNLEDVYMHNVSSPEYEYVLTTWSENGEYPIYLPKPINLHETFSSLKKLRFLELVGFNLYWRKTNEAENFPALEELRLCYCAIFNDLPAIPSLRSLCVYHSHAIDNLSYIWKNANHLKKLAICIDFTMVLQAVKDCENLKVLIVCDPTISYCLFEALLDVSRYEEYDDTNCDIPQVIMFEAFLDDSRCELPEEKHGDITQVIIQYEENEGCIKLIRWRGFP